MERLTSSQLAQFTPLKTKIQNLASKIISITEQGRLVEKDVSQLFLFKGMYQKLTPYYDSFSDTWEKLIEYTVQWGAPTIFPTQQDEALQKTVERYYYEGCAIYENYMNPTPVAGGASQSCTLSDSRVLRARLPQINLPQFSGDPADWTLFRDTYRSTVHEEASVSDIEKFLFLVSCLKGPALALIKGIELEADNYPQAWKLLNDTYNDKRRLAKNYLKTVLDFVPFKSRPSVSGLKYLLTSVCASIDSFKKLNIPDADDFILFCLLLRCLDPESRRAFERLNSHVDFPTYNSLVHYIRVEWRSIDLSTDEPHQQAHPQTNLVQGGRVQPGKGSKPKTSLLVDNCASLTSSSTKKKHPTYRSKSQHVCCPVCKKEHNLYQCVQFRKAEPHERLSLLKDWTGCKNCLSSKHTKQSCPSDKRCQTCGQDHHSWLHTPHTQPAPQTSPHSLATSQATSAIVLGARDDHGEVLLGTATIEIRDSHGTFKKIRAVTDSGSQHSFITQDCVEKLGLSIKPCRQTVSGIGQAPLPGMVGKLQCCVRSGMASGVNADLVTDAIVVSRITGDLPHAALSSATKELFRPYVLADDEFWRPGPVQFLLGGDLFFDIITGRPLTVAPDAPRLLPTIFGYVVGGPSRNTSTPQQSSCLLVDSTEDMKDAMVKFWEVEEIPKKCIISKEEQLCSSHFASTHYRLTSGRYVVSLPLKESVQALGNPRQQALRRLLNLECKLGKDVALKREYHHFMREYLTLGHMKLSPPGTAIYTIPHHAVLKVTNGQSKLRVVFDASCSTGSGSLNDHMYAGPKLQLDIGDVITNFRIHQYVFTADIVKMYRQIQVNSADRKYQHILWRFDINESVQEYELCTVTYGERASAFLAQATMRQLVHDEGDSYPLASRALMEDIYVDDIVTGASTVSELTHLREQLITLLGKGGLQLSKWASNCPEILQSLKEAELGDVCKSISDEEDTRIKLLGIQWNTKEDVFSYEICAPPWNPTKRAILSAIARVYDPLGFLSPVIFYAKILLQELWISKVGWDEIGPAKVCDKWRQFLDQLSCLSNIKLPRQLALTEASQYMIVGFSDASQRGYSAVLYLISVTPTRCNVALLKAKTKLAPVKPMAIPRLELSGSLLLCRLYQSCQSLISKLTISGSRFFTDSKVVLAWLSTPPEELNTFVAHRVVEILDHTEKNQWSFVPSQENPADCSSRGILPSKILSHPLWWRGPPWLSTLETRWPTFASIPAQDLPEMKRKPTTTLAAMDVPLDWMERFSSYPKMVRSIAFIFRFVQNLRHRGAQKGPITVSEYRSSGKILLRLVQSRYRTENDQLAKNKALRSLRLFLDEEGLVRVGGRLEHSQLPYDAKHPYLIPGDCHLTRLLVDHYHQAYLHLGPTALKAMLQNRYWIVGARGVIRKRVFNCITCYKASRLPQVPVMGNLPHYRLAEGQAFAHVGVDFGGPFFIRESIRRKAALGKAYLCLFVCMSTKAVHLEVVSKCTTDAFLAAFARFVARRGTPTHVHSDCGRNFVGAANKLKELTLMLRSTESQEQIMQAVVPKEIQWSFNPPSAPHFGGIWEAGIKSCKTILNKVIGENVLTFEELATLFCRIEGILNSRPLAPQESDPERADCLTPGHFLIGRPLTALPEEQLPANISLPQRWKIIQQKTQHFWARWRLEYLNHLQQRGKWTNDRRNLSVGDLVVVKDPNSTIKTWPLARVAEAHPGKDGIVRVVTIRTSAGLYKRPVAKLVPLLPIND